MFFKDRSELEKLELEAKIRLNENESTNTAKEVASKHLGKHAINYITFIVITIVVSSVYLESSALTAVVGLGSAVVMALIAMLQGITGTADKQEKPEFMIMNELIKNSKESSDAQTQMMKEMFMAQQKTFKEVGDKPKDKTKVSINGDVVHVTNEALEMESIQKAKE